MCSQTYTISSVRRVVKRLVATDLPIHYRGHNVLDRKMLILAYGRVVVLLAPNDICTFIRGKKLGCVGEVDQYCKKKSKKVIIKKSFFIIILLLKGQA
jgi:hypothetical protein